MSVPARTVRHSRIALLILGRIPMLMEGHRLTQSDPVELPRSDGYTDAGDRFLKWGKTVKRIVLKTRVGSDGSVHLQLPVGPEDAGLEIQVTVEPLGGGRKGTLLASDLLASDLVGMWAERTDIADNRAFARRLREQARLRFAHLAPRDMPGSGKPAELLAAAGIDAAHIASAVRDLATSGA